MGCNRFLHAALQVEALRNSASLRDALNSLGGLPSTINNIYSATLDRINAQPGAKPQLARQILTWLAYAHRLLTVDDLRYALAVQLTHPLPPNEAIIDPFSLVDGHVLLSVCCGLVVIDNSNRSVRLVRKCEIVSPATPWRAHLNG
jgi:ankyrin repeat domain-containing protein 50